MRYRSYSISKSLRNIETKKHCLHGICDFRERETYGSSETGCFMVRYMLMNWTYCNPLVESSL